MQLGEDLRPAQHYGRMVGAHWAVAQTAHSVLPQGIFHVMLAFGHETWISRILRVDGNNADREG